MDHGIGVNIIPYRLPLRRPWVAASAILAERRGALLCLTDRDGLQGWGDCAPLPSSGEERCAQVLAALEEGARRLLQVTQPLDDLAIPPEVYWAVETAQLDLEARRLGVPLFRLLDPQAPLSIAVNAALGPLDGACVARAEGVLAQGYAIGKIKVGVSAVEVELERLREICDATGGRLRLRLDANRAWDRDTAERFLDAIAGLPIDGVEEPLAEPTPAALAALQGGLPYPIAMDESLPRLGLAALIESRAVRRLVVKPARLGGFSATQAIARQAAAAGMELVLTSVVDSAIGVTAAAHLAAALSPDLAHGLGTGAWLAQDLAAAPPLSQGRMALPEGPGLGIRPF